MKKTLSLILTALLLLSLLMPVSAEPQLYNVTDAANLLTESEWQTLETRLSELSEATGCGIYIVTVEDYRVDYDGEILGCAEEVFLQYDLGLGDERNGLMLMLSMAERDFALIAHGTYANTTFPDWVRNSITTNFLDDFRENDWYGGFRDFADDAELYLYDISEPEDYGYGDETIGIETEPYVPEPRAKQVLDRFLHYFPILLIPCGIVALIICLILKGKMKTAIEKKDASDYITPVGLELTGRSDVFVRRTEHREVKPQENHSSGSGSGFSGGGGGSGFSGNSGKF